jgi:hypothetical protein
MLTPTPLMRVCVLIQKNIFFAVISALFGNETFSNILQNVKTCCFANSYNSTFGYFFNFFDFSIPFYVGSGSGFKSGPGTGSKLGSETLMHCGSDYGSRSAKAKGCGSCGSRSSFKYHRRGTEFVSHPPPPHHS